jgi:hypothetical protein
LQTFCSQSNNLTLTIPLLFSSPLFKRRFFPSNIRYTPPSIFHLSWLSCAFVSVSRASSPPSTAAPSTPRPLPRQIPALIHPPPPIFSPPFTTVAVDSLRSCPIPAASAPTSTITTFPDLRPPPVARLMQRRMISHSLEASAPVISGLKVKNGTSYVVQALRLRTRLPPHPLVAR